jgi:predicted metalloprotease with PDZ domain
MVSRGGGPQAHLLLGQQAQVADVIDSWVAVHELSHMLHPLLGLDDAWFGEGFASYHQNVLRARAGLMSEADAWTALEDGFRRGAAASERGPWTVSLQDASVQMRAEGRYLQVYWGGAAVVLWMDVALRQCADRSIDDVVATFRAEQPRLDSRRVPAREIVARAAAMAPTCAHITADVDALLRQPFLGDSLPALLEDLGIEAGTLTPTAPRAGVRDAITRPVLSVR